MTNMVHHPIRLSYHREERLWGIVPENGGEWDFGVMRSYRVISLVNCIGKVVERSSSWMAFRSPVKSSPNYIRHKWAEEKEKRSAIEVLATLVHTVQERWEEKASWSTFHEFRSVIFIWSCLHRATPYTDWAWNLCWLLTLLLGYIITLRDWKK